MESSNQLFENPPIDIGSALKTVYQIFITHWKPLVTIAVFQICALIGTSIVLLLIAFGFAAAYILAIMSTISKLSQGAAAGRHLLDYSVGISGVSRLLNDYYYYDSDSDSDSDTETTMPDMNMFVAMGYSKPERGKQRHHDCRALDGMTPLQEVGNALTMLSPSMVALVWSLHPDFPSILAGWRTTVMVVGCAVHLPFSLAYHLLLAKRILHDAVDCIPRRLDQTFIHVSCIGITAALTTSPCYFGVVALLNFYFISRLWSTSEAGLSERMANIGMGALFYLAAPLMRGDYVNSSRAAFCFALGVGATFARLDGWGHSIFHLCLGGLCYFCLLSASNLH